LSLEDHVTDARWWIVFCTTPGKKEIDPEVGEELEKTMISNSMLCNIL
jgi:hypothetical protein